MLGKLARWLRMLGYDAELASPEESDEEILERARIEGRVLLTRDKELGCNEGVLFFHSSDSACQMRVLVERFDLVLLEKPVPRFCSLCNGRLRIAVREDLPVGVSGGWVCVDCGQRYWKGSHWCGIKKFIKRVKRKS